MELVVVIVVTVAAVAAVLYPLLRGEARDVPLEAEQDDASATEVEEEIARYRTALRARTLCRRCGRANPEGSVFCAECGRRLEAGRRAPPRRGQVETGAGAAD
ncbi:MAG: zinc-ribbon domain-containing protein [Longimicrobiales bacterium]